ncbi:SDR family oxidoreductase [Streptomyces albidus (ex Kaewkla and Franco 2022)]|uniref:SDR family oxidoreductase n=1 Tax=Streptomyces albidus (ex Kaewkla and Franco 2022) TaxID=722709 RepID=UPI0015EFAE6D|nr:SDR family oxidoreductase [Streptomyces albidus (ex Kaewkla and Franco 2022)]
MTARKIALVTGGSRGIGRATALRLAADGAAVVVNYHTNAEAAAEVVDEIRKGGGEAVAVQADIGDPAQVRDLFDAVEENFDALDIFVNNANTSATFSTIADAPDEHFDTSFLTNTRSIFVSMREAARRLRCDGRIIFVSSGVTRMHIPQFGLYAATKAAGEQLIRTLSHECGTRGITANSVVLGPVRSASFDDRPGGAAEGIAKQTPLGRIGEPEDAAEVIAFLASNAGRWITGQAVNAGGGLY